MVWAGNKAKGLLSVNHTTKAIHHQKLIGRPEHSLTLHLRLRSNTSHFCFNSYPLPLKVDVICVSPLWLFLEKMNFIKMVDI